MKQQRNQWRIPQNCREFQRIYQDFREFLGISEYFREFSENFREFPRIPRNFWEFPTVSYNLPPISENAKMGKTRFFWFWGQLFDRLFTQKPHSKTPFGEPTASSCQNFAIFGIIWPRSSYPTFNILPAGKSVTTRVNIWGGWDRIG